MVWFSMGTKCHLYLSKIAQEPIIGIETHTFLETIMIINCIGTNILLLDSSHKRMGEKL